jgi:N-acetylmuramoyl-L-alanine amidase
MTVSTHASITYLPIPVTFNNTALPMESPLARMDDVIYMPLREWVIALNGRLSYLRKEDAYEIKVSGDNTIVAAPYSPELWISGRQHFMQNHAVYIDRQIYVPLEEFAWILGAKAEVSTAGVTIRFNGMRATTPSKAKSPKQITVLASREETKFMLDQIQLPNIRNTDNPILEIAGKKFPIKTLYLYHEDKLYLNFNSIFDTLGGKISQDATQIQVTIFDKKMIFSKNSQIVKIQQNGQEEIRYIADVVHTRDKVSLLSVQALASVLGLQPQWSSSQQTLTLASRLKLIRLQEQDNSLVLILKTSIPIAPSVPTSSGSVPRFEMVFPSTVLGFGSGELLSPTGPLSALRWRQEGTNTYLMLMYEETGHILKPIRQDDTWVISFQNRLSGLRQITHAGHSAIEISATHPFGIRGWMLDDTRLVLDMPDTISTLPLTITANPNSPYTKLRTSQFSWKPLSSRIVVDMTKKSGYTLIKHDAKTWRVVFDEKASGGTKSTPIPAPIKETKATNISSSPENKTGALKNKIIFIDPGHGGDDPGAIGPNDEYEKEFTLDISLRLGKLLTAQGAQVVYARTDDQNPTLQERVEMATKSKASLFVSVHINSFFHSFANGTETYYFKPEDKPFAEAVHPEIMKVTQGKNNGLKRARLYVLRNSTMPAILIEPLFITNKAELEKLKTVSFRQALAQSTMEGILRYYGK